MYGCFHGAGPGDSGVAYRTLNVIRSAISAVAFIDGNPAGRHPLVCRFMRAAQNTKPAFPRYASTWDPEIVFTYLDSLGDNDQLSLLLLSRKLTLLLLLLSGQRFQSIELLDIRNMSLSSSKAAFRIADALKTSTPWSHLQEVSFLAFLENANLCVVHALTVYLRRTRGLRGSITRLLISTRPPYQAVTRSTLARWTRDLMEAAGIDVHRFRPYSVKAAGVSAAARSLSLSAVMSAVGWRRESTFRTFYHMPVSAQGEFGVAVLSGRL